MALGWWKNAWFNRRGARLITCPENQRPAGVALKLQPGALELKSCSLWPEKQGCGQGCLSQIAESQDGCLVRGILERWFEGKSCVLCGQAVGSIHWPEHGPALIDRERKTVEWNTVKTEELPETLERSLPVCWACHNVEVFLQQHPEMVTDRSRVR